MTNDENARAQTAALSEIGIQLKRIADAYEAERASGKPVHPDPTRLQGEAGKEWPAGMSVRDLQQRASDTSASGMVQCRCGFDAEACAIHDPTGARD